MLAAASVLIVFEFTINKEPGGGERADDPTSRAVPGDRYATRRLGMRSHLLLSPSSFSRDTRLPASRACYSDSQAPPRPAPRGPPPAPQPSCARATRSAPPTPSHAWRPAPGHEGLVPRRRQVRAAAPWASSACRLGAALEVASSSSSHRAAGRISATNAARCSFSNPAAGSDPGAPGLLLAVTPFLWRRVSGALGFLWPDAASVGHAGAYAGVVPPARLPPSSTSPETTPSSLRESFLETMPSGRKCWGSPLPTGTPSGTLCLPVVIPGQELEFPCYIPDLIVFYP
ncbi:homeobox protein unc-4 homolog [Panicum hallii]|uniref:homeobox protein unc-4 homolog n=1 Tax=Panicum hallii TaxID=206008 RepID=UPI000DF4DF97|nr:homeobox protein unc-4 homolog [Panicum hallii]